MAFHEVRFPANLSFGSVGGPERRTEIVTLANGHEERNSPWAHARRRYDAGVGLRSLDDVAHLIAFFEARAGQVHAFRWKDWADHKSCLPSQQVGALDQNLGRGDGVQRVWQLQKIYRSGDNFYTRVIRKPVAGTVQVAVDGVALAEGLHWNVNIATGEISFVDAPDQGVEVSAGFEFDVPVRFDSDLLDVTLDIERLGSITSIPLVEIRL